MDNLGLIITIIIGLLIFIPFLICFIIWTKRTIKQANWQALFELTVKVLQQSQRYFQNEVQAREFIALTIQTIADEMEYTIDDKSKEQMVDAIIGIVTVIKILKDDEEDAIND